MWTGTYKAGVGRGVWIAPWLGENGGMILVAVTRYGRRAAERTVAFGEDSLAASDELWGLLDQVDPVPRLQVI